MVQEGWHRVIGKRREPRKDVRVPVRIFGTDSSGRVFSEKVFTVNVSQQGVELEGVQAQINHDEIIGLSYGTNKGHFRLKWAGGIGSPKAGHVGLLNLSPEKPIWDFALPETKLDEYRRETSTASERRQHPRLRTINSVELHPVGQAAPIWGKAVDLSIGGCFVEMPMPLKQGTPVKIGLWIKELKLWINGRVASSRPGFGIGLQFTSIAPQDAERLKQFLQSITKI